MKNGNHIILLLVDMDVAAEHPGAQEAPSFINPLCAKIGPFFFPGQPGK